ncbi:restriction endonuclease subunit S [Lactococcus plantarum]|uniref:restriction endonuclease subunit S n=1 Tax=Pseudolactococcus plantarum TaxID=1365 RepID=UPI000A49880F|nr:restriction endonuclease subunit S [Lactococcus plantarum]
MSKKSPQLRFEGFTDDWEQRKLGDVISISSEKNGNQFSRADVLSVSREAGVVNQIEYQGRSFAGASIANYRVVHKGDLIYTKSPLKGAPNGIFKTSEAEGIVSPLYAVYQSREANAAFVGWLLSNDNFATHYLYPLVNKGSKNTLLVSDADAISGHLSFPNIEEQAKIVSFFTQLDNLIALHQRKLDLLKEQKKGYLQKMFPKNGEKVPELRFAGFADDWEERKLGELSKDTFGGGTPKTSVTEYWNGEIPWIQSSDLSSDHLFGVLPKKHITENAVKNSATKLIPKNSIAIVTRVGVGKLAFMPYEFTSSQDFLSLSNLQVDCNFGMYSIYKMLQRELNNIQGTSIKGITKADLLDKEVIIPVEFEEQKKIGSFFKQLDNTIALHQRKLDLLKEQKKGFLQKMFV